MEQNECKFEDKLKGALLDVVKDLAEKPLKEAFVKLTDILGKVANKVMHEVDEFAEKLGVDLIEDAKIDSKTEEVKQGVVELADDYIDDGLPVQKRSKK